MVDKMSGLATVQAGVGPTTTLSFLRGEAGAAKLHQLRPVGLWLCRGDGAGDGGKPPRTDQWLTGAQLDQPIQRRRDVVRDQFVLDIVGQAVEKSIPEG